jgi:predicted ester cyclase
MTAEDNKAEVRRYYEDIWNAGDLTVIDECMGPEVLAHLDGDDHVSRDRWRDVITLWRRAFPDIHHVVDRLVGEGDIVAANIRVTGTHRGILQLGSWGPWAPTGKSVNVKEANFFRLAGARWSSSGPFGIRPPSRDNSGWTRCRRLAPPPDRDIVLVC